jgi:hypothetical protein
MGELIKHEEMNCVQDERIRSIESKLASLANIEQSIKNIEIGLIGSDQLGIPGLVKRVDKHSESIRFIQKIYWIAIGAIGLISIIWTVYVGVK